MPTLRLMEGANRLTELVLECGAVDDDGWLSGFLNDSKKGLELIGNDREAFEEFMKVITLQLAIEMKRNREGN